MLTQKLLNKDNILRCFLDKNHGKEGVTCYYNAKPYFRRFQRKGGSRLSYQVCVEMIQKELLKQGKPIKTIYYY